MLQEFNDKINKKVNEILKSIHTVIAGKIIKFDAKKSEADVQPFGKIKKVDGSFIDYPKITGVPVFFLQSCSQDFLFVHPVKEGDFCLLFFSEQSLEFWRNNSVKSITDLNFDLTNAIAMVGLPNKATSTIAEAQAKQACILKMKGSKIIISDNSLVLENKNGGKITLNGSGIKAEIGGSSLTIKNDSIDIKANTINLKGTVVEG